MVIDCILYGGGSIRMTVLLEYLDLALDTHSWVSLDNSLAFTQIPQELSMMTTPTTEQFSVDSSKWSHYITI